MYPSRNNNIIMSRIQWVASVGVMGLLKVPEDRATGFTVHIEIYCFISSARGSSTPSPSAVVRFLEHGGLNVHNGRFQGKEVNGCCVRGTINPGMCGVLINS